MLTLSRKQWLQIVNEAWRVYPLEACGLLVGDLALGSVNRFVPIHNAAESSKLYALDGRQFSKESFKADADGLEVMGVVHSHTHTLAYPSPTDVTEGTRPLVPLTWHWPILSLAWGFPELRSFQFTKPAEETESDEFGILEEPVRLLE